MPRSVMNEHAEPVVRPVAGILWMLLTGILFVAVTGIVRHLGSDMPAPEAAFIRYAIGLILILPAFKLLLTNMPTAIEWRNYAVRGVVHGVGVMLWFYAMARIPIAEVTAIGYTAPIFVTIGAALFLGERLQVRRIGAVLAAFGGALVILRPGFQELNNGQLAQVCAAPLFAASFLLAKKFTADAPPSLIVAMLSVFCTLTLLPAALLNWHDPTWEEVGWLALTACFATAGHYTLTQAFRCAPITLTQPVQFLQLVWATLLGMAVFGEALDPYVLVGGAVIVGSATYISHREMVVARRAQTPPATATKV
ncbi:MAG: DMT family transporter [Pseudomonadota bacterium]